METYKLDEDHNIIPEPSLKAWGYWFEKADRNVSVSEVDGVVVDTCFLGLDHSFGGEVPILFETLIMGGERDGEITRYSTWEEATRGHNEIVESLRARCDHCLTPKEVGRINCSKCGAPY